MLIHCHVDAMQQLVTEMDKVAVGAAAVDDQDAAKTNNADVYVCTGHPSRLRYVETAKWVIKCARNMVAASERCYPLSWSTTCSSIVGRHGPACGDICVGLPEILLLNIRSTYFTSGEHLSNCIVTMTASSEEGNSQHLQHDGMYHSALG